MAGAASPTFSRAFFAGGRNGFGQANQRVDIFRAINGEWFTQSLSSPRSALAATSVGSLFLFGGGYDHDKEDVSDIVDVFDVTKSLRKQLRLSEPRSNLAATSNFNTAIFAG